MLDHQQGILVPKRPPTYLVDQRLIGAIVVGRIGKDQIEFSKVSLQKGLCFSTDQLDSFRVYCICERPDEVDGLGIGIHRKHKWA